MSIKKNSFYQKLKNKLWRCVTLQQFAEKQLRQVILPYWQACADQSHGGFCGYVNYNLTPDWKAHKGVILNSRILWFFSAASSVLEDRTLLDYAKHAYRFMQEHCIDVKYGGVYWMMDYTGRPVDTLKHAYNQAFAIYGLSAYYEASGDSRALTQAMELFELIERQATDLYGYHEAFTRSWQPVENDKLSENGIVAHKTMNTILHLLEAYTELYRLSRDVQVGQRLRWLLDRFREKVYNPELQRLEVFFDSQMDPLINLQSYGHDIEAAWLLDRAADLLGDSSMEAVTTALVDTVVERAMQPEGCVINECHNGKNDQTRVWWVQAEALVSLYSKYTRTGQERYLTQARAVGDYIQRYFVDQRQGGEWFWDLDSDNLPSSHKPITEPWKCPYHNGRMCIELIRRTKK